MGIVRFALRFPHTFYVVATLILFLGVTTIYAMPTDIFGLLFATPTTLLIVPYLLPCCAREMMASRSMEFLKDKSHERTGENSRGT
jgi:hypothetical protein